MSQMSTDQLYQGKLCLNKKKTTSEPVSVFQTVLQWWECRLICESYTGCIGKLIYQVYLVLTTTNLSQHDKLIHKPEDVLKGK